MGHAEFIADGFNIDLPGNVCPESFLLAGKKRLHIVKAIHHLVTLCLHSRLRKFQKY
jgi:hypothetical protein